MLKKDGRKKAQYKIEEEISHYKTDKISKEK